MIAEEEASGKASGVLSELRAAANDVSDEGMTPAIFASWHGKDSSDKDVVVLLEVLHKLGADLNIAHKDGATPAFMASQNGHFEHQVAPAQENNILCGPADAKAGIA